MPHHVDALRPLGPEDTAEQVLLPCICGGRSGCEGLCAEVVAASPWGLDPVRWWPARA